MMPFSIFGIERKARCGSSSYVAQRVVIQHGVLQCSFSNTNSHPQIPSLARNKIVASHVACFGAPESAADFSVSLFFVLRFSEQSEVKTTSIE